MEVVKIAASIQFRHTDGITPVTSLDLGSLPPNSSYSSVNGAEKKLALANTGNTNFGQATLQIQQVGSDPSHNWASLYEDDNGNPTGDPVATGGVLELGEMLEEAVEFFHLDVAVPPAQTSAAHVFNLYAVGIVEIA